MPNREPVASLLGGKYRILDRLGGGGLGDVYRGEHTSTARPVAVKILRPDLATEKALVSRFFQEAQAVNKIRHPNIVDILDAGMSEGTAFVAMECLSGEASSSALARLGKLSFQAVVAIGVEVLDALDAAHRAGVVHRDLKPENVFLHRPMADVPVTVKVLDFAADRLYAASSAGPRLHVPIAMGTTDYVSPEQAVGDAVTDGRTDIFSLAIVLFELLTGQRPFRAATAVATAYRVVHAPQPTFAEVGLPAHPMLEAIIGKALSKRPADRYATAADFARELLRAAPDPRRRAQALQEVLGDPASGTLPAHSPSTAPRPASSPPLSSAPPYHRSSVSALRISLSSRPPDFGSGFPPEATDARSSSVAPPPSESMRSSRPSSGRERATSAPPAMAGATNCHVRGHVLRAADHFILGAHGATVRDRILARLPARYSDDFRHGSITGVVLYDLDVFDAYAGAANAIVLGNEPNRWREIGRGSVEGELASLMRTMRTLSRSADEAALFRRCLAIWSRFTDFGAWTTDLKREGEVVVHVSDLGPAPLTLRQWLVGVVEQTLRHAGHTGTTVAMRAGEAPRTPELDLLIHLR
jgi:serine/threonine protein kinase